MLFYFYMFVFFSLSLYTQVYTDISIYCIHVFLSDPHSHSDPKSSASRDHTASDLGSVTGSSLARRPPGRPRRGGRTSTTRAGAERGGAGGAVGGGRSPGPSDPPGPQQGFGVFRFRFRLLLWPFENAALAPRKLNMEPENHWVVDEHLLPKVCFQVPC